MKLQENYELRIQYFVNIVPSAVEFTGRAVLKFRDFLSHSPLTLPRLHPHRLY